MLFPQFAACVGSPGPVVVKFSSPVRQRQVVGLAALSARGKRGGAPVWSLYRVMGYIVDMRPKAADSLHHGGPVQQVYLLPCLSYGLSHGGAHTSLAKAGKLILLYGFALELIVSSFPLSPIPQNGVAAPCLFGPGCCRLSLGTF